MAEEQQARCSFQSYIGPVCTCARIDKTKSTEIIPLLSCTMARNISKHKKVFGFSDVADEVELLMARVNLFVLSVTNRGKGRFLLQRIWSRKPIRSHALVLKRSNLIGFC